MARHHELIVAYGYGDGGGGPTRELIETAHILKDMPGVPNVCPGTVREFFEGIEATCAPDLPVWNGELYLELHRGTLTSESRTKRNNRKSEFVLHDTEFLSAFAAIVGGFHYPHDKLTECWERVCLNQFHDILPGTAIEEVFHDAERDYLFVRDTLEDIREKAIGHLAALLPEETAAVAINPSPFSADRVGYLPGPDTPPLKNLATGETIAMQKVYGGTLIDLAALPCYGVQALGLVDDDGGQPATKPDGVTIHQDDDGIRIETPLLEVIIGAHGELTRVFDKQAGRDAIKPGETGNQLLVFEDRPMTWDAWDIDVFYEDRSERITDLQKIEVIEEGPLRASVLIERKYRSSTIRQRICVYAHTKRIDFATRVDWYETHTLLKAAFPVDILSPRATFDIQWGNVERNTHRNSSWDFARFESVAQKWADLSEGNFGVALLNNCKYGYDIRDDVMRITLVKSATMPNPHADQGEHLVTYSLMPHRGNWRNGVQAAAYDLNDPVIVRGLVGGEGDQAEMALARTDQPYAVIETIKQAEDGRGIIVRMYECERSRGKVTVHFGVRMASVNVVNILEHDAEPVPLTGDGAAVEVYLKPFEIISLRCIPA
ncbi:MAG: glycoside hydrolase family 38 C-terminal domain-containing protein [Pseudomonadota bacterium]